MSGLGKNDKPVIFLDLNKLIQGLLDIDSLRNQIYPAFYITKIGNNLVSQWINQFICLINVSTSLLNELPTCTKTCLEGKNGSLYYS